MAKVTKIPLEDAPKDGAAAYSLLKDSMGRFRTLSLFYESRHPDYPAPFTLKDQEHKGRTSMYQKYMEIGDPTEYSQAIGLLGSWKHWVQLTSTQWFKPYITRWRDELRVKFESDRYREMREVASKQAGTPQGVQASKWLAQRYSTTPDKPKRGRPSKAEKAQHLKEEIDEQHLLQEEADRLGLSK